MPTQQELEKNRLAFNERLVEIRSGSDTIPTPEEQDESERRKLELRLNRFAVYAAQESTS